MGIACFFQGASPVLLVGGGRISGLPPAYLIMMIGAMYIYIVAYARKKRIERTIEQISPTTKALILFTIIGIIGAFVLPRIFEGTGVRVLSSGENAGLDGGFPIPLEPKGTNFFQAFYLLCHLIIFVMTHLLVKEGAIKREDVLNGIMVGALISLSLGFYQVIAHYLDWPWPSNILNSNFGHWQWYESTAGGLPRISSTFKEASIFAMHFLGALGIFGLGLQKRFFGVLILIGLILSTSTTAYFGLVLLFIVWAVLDMPRRAKKTIISAFILLLIIIIAIALDYEVNDGNLIDAMIFDKFEGFSGRQRMNAESMAIDTFYDTFGLGAGVGSMRCSSLITTLLACTGVPGVLSFCFFICFLLQSSFRSNNELDRAVMLGLIGLLIGWLIAVPDIANPLFWFLAGLVPLGAKVGHRVNA
jgi:hypothetical protein